MSEDSPRMEENTEPTPAAHFTRETLLGCLGLFCVLLTLPLLWLAVVSEPRWLAHALPPLAFAAAIGGAALTLRVPAGRAARSSDPQRPLTHAGSAPTIERPASRGNRLAWALTAALIACALAGYALEVIRSGGAWGLALMLVAGVSLMTQGILVGLGRMPMPALRWLRFTIYGQTGHQSAFLMASGFVTLAGALFLALLDGDRWGLFGLALLVVALVLIAPLARRMPRRSGPLRTND